MVRSKLTGNGPAITTALPTSHAKTASFVFFNNYARFSLKDIKLGIFMLQDIFSSIFIL